MQIFALLATSDAAFNLLAARWQMGITLGAHIILAVFGVAMPVLLLAAEWRYLTTGDPVWRALAYRWSKVFAVLFAVGAVSGTVLSFELGLLWPEFMARYGPVIAFPFAMEGFAFFLEAIFVGIYLYGWNRLPPWTHWWCGVPIATSGVASAWFVVTVNAWMNSPQGVRFENGRVVDIDPLAALVNPCTGPQTAHMIVGAYMVAGFLVGSYYAGALLRNPISIYSHRAMTLGLLLGTVMTPMQFVVGDWMARRVAQVQPVKLAAMEGQFQSQAGAPLRIGGFPDEKSRRTGYGLEIPGMLSWLAYGDRNALVNGLDSFPRENTPPVAVVHIAFQVMVAIGTLLLLLSLYVFIVGLARRKIPDGPIFLRLLAVAGPLALVALEAGWVVTEVGRQPWIVQGVTRTHDMVTAAPYVGWMLVVTVGIYTVIVFGTIAVLRQLARLPMPEETRAA
ncbi:MAG: cytochrome ubiquinol oxidase subunit I [Planctomycetia bacterium]|nr:cytochrome ubiquinol oxidase subunit I [Planctomycetia bacterium]